MRGGFRAAPVLENTLSGRKSKQLRRLAKLAHVPTTRYLQNTRTHEVVLGKCDRKACKELKKMGKKLDIGATTARIEARRMAAV